MIEYNHIDHPPQGNLLNILFELYNIIYIILGEYNIIFYAAHKL